MKNHHHALLTELLIVIIFFMLASTVLLQVFAAARGQSDRAAGIAEAVSEAQTVADTLWAAGDADSALTALGFAAPATGEDAWRLHREGYELLVQRQEEQQPAGTLTRCTVTAVDGAGETLLSLPTVRFREVSP